MENIDSRWDQQTLGDIIGAFNHIDEIGDSQWEDRCRKCEQLFTSGVATLRMMKILPVISDLMANVWDIYHYRHVVLGMGPNVPTLCFAIVEKNKMLQALTFAPYVWPEMIEADSSHELGSIITVGSQAVDFYNNKILSFDDSKVSKERSLSYEAEFIHMLARNGHTLNEYQKGVLSKYPNGFDSSFAYPKKAVAVPSNAS
jgi:hypothetical protein